MTLRVRTALPPVSPSSPITAADTSVQAQEGYERVADYVSQLRAEDLSLPADPRIPRRLSVIEIARESGVCVSSLRAGSPSRQLIENYKVEAGLAITVKSTLSEALSVDEFLQRLPLLAQRAANREDLPIEVSKERLINVGWIIARRAGGRSKGPIGPIMEELTYDASADHLDVPDSLSRLFPNLISWHDELNSMPEALNLLDFSDLLADALRRVGLNRAMLASRVGVKTVTLTRWLTGESVPRACSYPALTRIEQLADFPEGILHDAKGPNQRWATRSMAKRYVPERHRSTSSRGVVGSVRSRLPSSLYALPETAFQQHIDQVFEDVEQERKPGCDRYRMRQRHRIDRSRYSSQLQRDLINWSRDMDSQGLAPETIKAYVNAVEGLLAYGLSDEVSPALRVEKNKARLSVVCSPQLWNKYFEWKTDNGRTITGNDKFQINRASVERLKIVQQISDPGGGYISRDPDLVRTIRDLGPSHLYFISGAENEAVLLHRVTEELREVRKKWMGRSRRPIRGRDEIPDLLKLDNPIIAVQRMILSQRDLVDELGRPNARYVDYHHFATAMRLLMAVHLLGQTALRVGMLQKITVGSSSDNHLLLRPGRPPFLRIPAHMFKNGSSEVFRDGPYERELQDWCGAYRDLERYMRVARPILAAASGSELLLPVRGGGAWLTNNVRNGVDGLSRRSIGSDAPPEMQLIRRGCLRPHHFRDILATQVLHDTNRDYALAADAIHVTEKTCREYYAFDSPSMRRGQLHESIRTMGDN